MNISAEHNTTTYIEDDYAPDAAVLRMVRAMTVAPPAPAGNDESCADPASPADAVDAWARHALARNGFGDAEVAPPSSFDVHARARAERAREIGDLIADLSARAWSMAHRAYALHQQYRLARANYLALRELDDRTLRDIGFQRDDLGAQSPRSVC